MKTRIAAELSLNSNHERSIPFPRRRARAAWGAVLAAGLSIWTCDALAGCAPTPAGLVSWWRGEGNGSDATGSNDAFLFNGVGFAPSEVGQGFSFDGVDDRVIVSNSPSLNFGPGADFSIEAWIQPLPAVTDFGVQSIVDKRFTPNFAEAVGYTFALVDGKLACQLADAPLASLDFSSFVSPGPDLRDGQFHHVAMAVSRAATDGGKLYVDGQVVLTFDPTLQPGDLSTTEPLRIGNHADPALNANFKGRIDEVAIYNRALSPNEVAGIYNAGSAGKCGLPPFVAPFTNGSFELPALAPGSGQSLPPGSTVITGWTVGGVVGMGWQNGASFGANPVDGVQHIGFNGGDAAPGSYIFQTFSTTVGQTYAVSFYVGRNGSGSGTMSLLAAVTSSGGALLGSLNAVAPGSPGYGLVQTFTFAATTSASTLTFTDTSSATIAVDVLLDHVSVIPVTQCVPPPTGLVSWWRAEGDALDSVAAGNHGTPNSATPFSPAGVAGQAFKFNGLADKIDLGDPPSLRLTNAFTIEGWILASNAPTGPHSQILFRGDTRHCLDPYYFSLQPSRAIRLHVAANEVLLNPCGVDLETAPVPLNQWLHVAGVFDGASDSMSIFIDGVQAAQMNTSVKPFADLDPAYTPAVVIGNTIGFTDQGFNGLIDELAIYNRALNSNEIAGIFLAGSAAKCPPTNPPPASCATAPSGLVSWWRGEANALDQAGTNNGTLAGNTTFTSGRVGQGFIFDGNGTVVQLGNPANLHFQDLTIETWLRRASTAVTSLNGNGNGVIFGYHIGGYGLYLDPSGTPALSKIGINEVKPSVTITDTNLHHLAVTKSGSTVVFYVDGAAYPAAAYDPGFTFSENAFIGGLGNEYTFYGTVDEVSVYSRPLAANEIQAIHTAGSAGKCVSPSPTNSCATTPSGLVSWWNGETNAADTTGVNPGQLTGTTTFAAGQVGQAFLFDGGDGLITVSASPSLNVGLGAGLTIETWIKPSSVELERPIAEWNSVTGGNPYPYGVHFWISVPVGYGAGPGCLYANIVDTAGNFHWLTSAGGLINTNSFQHVAMTYDQSSGLAALLLNGAVVAQQNLGSFTPQTSYNLYLGGRPGGAAAAFRWVGLLDEVSLYSRALGQAEIQAIYAAGGAGKCVVSNPPLVAPVIVSPPTNVTVYVGSNATFRVTATGSAPLAYQWRLNGNDLPAKTASVLSLTSVQFSNAGPYSVVVSNVGGSVTSPPALLTVNPLPNCVPPPAGLVSWWRAENDSTDNWGTNNGTRFGTTFAPGKVGQAFSAPRISAADALSLHATNGLTLEAWVSPVSFRYPTPQTIISKFDMPLATPVGTQSAYLLGFTNNGRLFFTVSATGSARTNTTLATTQTLPTNQWSFVVATYDGAALRIYLNGTLAAQTDYSAGIFPGTAPLGLGAIFLNALWSDAIWPFTGLLDEASLYNRALTDGEIQAIYNADFAGKCLVAPTIVTQPQDQAVPLGEDVKFTVAATGTKPFKYQWRFNNAVIAGATNSALVLEKVKTNQAGLYHVAVTNAVGFAISTRAQLNLSPAPTCTDSPAGLISWWPGDTNLFDAMGANSIASFSPTTYVTGKVDRAFSFNGTSSRIILNNSHSLNFGSNVDFSIEMWIKAGPSNAVYANVPLFEKRSTSTAWVGYSLSLNLGRLAFTMGSSPASPTNVSAFISSGPDLRDGMFHHVAVSVNRTNSSGGRLFVDGNLVLTFDPTPREGSLISETPLFLGAPTVTTTNSYFGGLIDEPAIYNRALTPSEILAIRHAGAAGKCKAKPSILVQPASQRVTVGSNVTFSVTAAGSPRLRYQWLYQGGKIIPWGTNAVCTITNVSDRPSPETGSPGTYSCRITNLFGSMLSSNAVLTLNFVPVAFPQTVSLNEDTPTSVTLSGRDRDPDPLSYLIVAAPSHGILSGTGSNTVYTPSPNYNGQDSFTFTVNDGLVDSAPATVSLTILPVNDPPVAFSQSVALDEDTTAAITLGAFDAENDPLTFTLGTPAHGTLTGTPPNLSYRPVTNYFGPDSFTFKVNDGQLDSLSATVSFTVRPVNDAPEPKIVVSPLTQLPGFSNLVVIAPGCRPATVFLDASQSSDVEHNPLQYDWTEGTNSLGRTAILTNRFAPGRHTVTLRVNDGADSVIANRTFAVLTPEEAVYSLAAPIVEADLGPRHTAPLLATLHGAAEAFERCKPVVGILLLKVFQHQIHAVVAPKDPALAESLIGTSEEIIYIVEGSAAGRRCAVFDQLTRWGNGSLQMRFCAPKSRNYFVQATTNTMDWEIIGVAEARGDGTFLFDDPFAGKHTQRFYRIVSE